MEIPNLNCKWCEHVADVDRKCCEECLFSLYEVLSDTNNDDKLTDKDWDFCMWCWFKHTQPEKCDWCIWNKLD